MSERTLTSKSLRAKAALVMLVCLVLGSLLPVGCVETAECDETVRCNSEDICYDFTCRRRCQAGDSCGEGFTCAPCLTDDATGRQDHCFGRDVMACVPEEQ